MGKFYDLVIQKTNSLKINFGFRKVKDAKSKANLYDVNNNPTKMLKRPIQEIPARISE